LRKRHTEILVHTGQHYDDKMSAVFFQELDIPIPDHNLNVGSGSHGRQTGEMLDRIEQVLVKERPDWVLVYGDTNSTLAGTLAAAKLHIPVAHVEAGLRSFNRAMPEEINRVLADHLSSLLFCPSQTAVENLKREGITSGVHFVGDVMADVLFDAVERAMDRSDILRRLGVKERQYLVATVHRAENTDDGSRLRSIYRAFTRMEETVVFPVHPRTRKRLAELGLDTGSDDTRNMRIVEPLGYLDMIRLMLSARMILTDSGGIQKEAYWLRVPCVTLRDETEWIETVQVGWNVLVGSNTELILQKVVSLVPPSTRPSLYGDGRAARYCIEKLQKFQDPL